MMSPEEQTLLARYNKQVPRYTSYPTAPHFRHDINDVNIKERLEQYAHHNLCSLYFHIPFCHQLCHYCGCFTKVTNNASPVKSYLETLKEEVRLIGRDLPQKPVAGHVHFGGGSPNILSGEDLADLFDLIREFFVISCDAEIAMEMDPRLLTVEKIKAYAKAGINRCSLGVQDFQQKTQKAVNRIQPYEMIRDSVWRLQDEGIESINFDLMYGLPYQTVNAIEDNIEKAYTLSPDRVALFGYAHVPWKSKHQKLLDKYSLPDEEERWRQEKAARQFLTGFSYKEIGIDHFVKCHDDMYQAYQNKTLRRNFQGYTTDKSHVLLGFGLSAISRYPDMYIQNTTDIQEYRQALSAGCFPVERGCIMNKKDHCRADIIEQLMCYFEVSPEKVSALHGIDATLFDPAMQELAPLQQDGLVRIDDGTITVTDAGRPFVRTVAACFDAYYNGSEMRHSQAI